MMKIKTEITIEKGYDKIVLTKEEAEKLYMELKQIFDNVIHVPYQRLEYLLPKSVDTYTTCGESEYIPCNISASDTLVINQEDLEKSHFSYTIKL